jgi:hypothetical protein
MAFRVVTGLVGVFFSLQALQWIVLPQAAAEGLGMPLLDGVGRSTQIGDIGALFATIGGASLLGAIRRSATWLRAGAWMLGSAAAIRIVAWAAHDAPFAVPLIPVEVVVCAWLLFAAARIDADADAAPSRPGADQAAAAR